MIRKATTWNKLSSICKNCGKRYGLHYGENCPIFPLSSKKVFKEKKVKNKNGRSN